MKHYRVFDNVFNYRTKLGIEQFLKSYRYGLGWSDTQENNHLLYMHARLFKKEMDDMGFFQNIQNKDLLKAIDDRDPETVVANVSFPGYYYFPHWHRNQESLVYYVNMEWKQEWAGETIVYEDDCETVHACMPFSSGKVLWLNKDVLHSMRPPSLNAPFYRFTISMFFNSRD
jgi:Rps23 Pro-64 3,4-dihydroxylase Tpa1-like proline 4-hydroxylase